MLDSDIGNLLVNRGSDKFISFLNQVHLIRLQ